MAMLNSWTIGRRSRIGLAILCLLIAVGFSGWSFGSRALARKPVVEFQIPDDFKLQRFSVTNRKGDQLAGWHRPGENQCGVVLITHGRGSNKADMIPRARIFNEAGLSVAMFDFRGHGESGGEKIEFGYSEADDVRAVVTQLESLYPGRKIGAVGSSLGAVALTYSGIKAEALVLEAMYATLFETVVYRTPFKLLRELQAHLLLLQVPLRLGYSAGDVRPEDGVKRIWAPTMVLAGTRDQYVDRDQTQRIYDNLPGLKKLVWLEGAKHQDLRKFAPDKYKAEVVPFLKRYLCAETS